MEPKFLEYDPTAKPVQWIEYSWLTAENGGAAEKEKELAQFPSNRSLVLIQSGENIGFAGSYSRFGYQLSFEL